MSSEQEAISATKKWLDSLVIAQNFCPFAKRVFEAGRIHYRVVEADTIEPALHDFSSICRTLDIDREVETALLIFPKSFGDFDDYLDLLAAAQELLELLAYEGVYQVASFHPKYCFEGAAEDDPANYTNRSPYPMLHLLREESVENALTQYPKPELIPDNNIRRARELGLETLRSILRDSYDD